MLPGPLNNEDTFPFKCCTCGECCSGTMKVFLNPADVITFAGHFGMKETLSLWENDYLMTEEGQNGILVPRLKFTGLAPGFCPFVVNNWNEETSCLKGTCSVHASAKPLICKLAPIAREVDIEEGEEEYFIKEPVEGCPGMKEIQEIRVEEYLTPLSGELEWEKRWFTLLKIGLDRNISPEVMLKKFFYLEVPVDFEKLLSSWEKDPDFKV